MAAVDYFLKLDGIPGESHPLKDHIDIESWSWGETNTGTGHMGGGHGGGKVVMQDIHFTSKINKASPKIFLACADGTHIKSAELLCRKAGGKQDIFLKYKLTDVLISSYQTGGSGHSDIIPTDQFSLNFAKIEMEYSAQKQDGSMEAPLKAGYDLKLAKKV